ncbi:diguanylate cyclase [Enemella evansiae]|uniref:ABC transporter permease n=1 Tax=Enemella evansiae TaxID=2016499 RepID=UPI000B97084B|nr:ABC transporter permease [Enemella evansiae]OYO13821.1 diguanylate cyclase [Enemella evansiae]
MTTTPTDLTTQTGDGTGAPITRRRPWRRLFRSVPGVIGVVLTGLLLLLALLAWLQLTPYDPLAQNAPQRLRPPSAQHLFGTDQFGRDVFSRVAAGLGNSVRIALLAVALSAALGTLAGLVGGYFRKGADTVLGGVANVLFAFPPLLLALTLASVLTRNWVTVAIAIAVVYVPIFYRVTRGPVLSLREVEFVRAAVSTGQNPWAVMFRHVLPNITGLVIVQVALSLSWAVLTEASLSFLGLGTPPPAPSLGSMIFEANSTVYVAPWTMVAPGVLVVLLVSALNLLGDGLRDVLDPREAR